MLTSPGTLTFDLRVVAMCPSPEAGDARRMSLVLPDDLLDVVDQKGDRFRDDFTRACLYLANRHIDIPDPGQATVIVATEYGNLDAMLRLQRQAAANEGPISAQQFPHATTSSASTFVNLGKGITGGNMTLNAGPLNSVVALLQAALHIAAHPEGSSHVFIGDAYCAEAHYDAVKKDRDRRSPNSAVLYACVTGGARLDAQFAFGRDAVAMLAASPSADADEYRSHLFADHELASAWRGPVTVDAKEGNRTFLAYEFLQSCGDLPTGARSLLIASHDDRLAGVAVTRLVA